MNTKLLKQKILDLAIRGKLTQQLKSDGTAADLLKEIADAKSALSQPKGKKSKDSVQITPLDKNEAPFEIPANWEWVRLGDLCSKFSTGPFGTMLHKEDYVLEGGVPLVNPTNLQDGVIESDKIKLVKLEKYESLRPYILETNDIVLARRGDLSKCAVVSENENLWLAGTGAFFLKLILVDVHFFTRLYRTSFVQSYLVADSIGSTMDNLNQTTLGNLPVPLPPLAEQQRIVEKIQEAFAEIDSIENNKELLKTHIKQARQKILDLAIHGKLVPQNKSDESASVLLERITRDNPHYEKLTDIPFEIPDSWEWVKLTDIVEINPKNKLDDNLEVSFIPMNLIEAGYSNRHAQESRSWKDVKKGFTHFAENDVALAKISPCFENKKSAIMRNLKNGYGAGTTELFVFRPLEVMLAHYLLWIVKSDNFIQAGTGNFSGVVGQQRLSREVIENYPIPVPPLAEQKRIVDKIEEIFASLDEISLHLV
jgi:type I restriction enzyme S subunit